MKKSFAETIVIDPQPKQVGEYVFSLTQKYISMEIESWDNFVLDTLYERLKKEEITKCLIISKKDLKEFLQWAIPKYRKKLEKESKK